MNNNNKFIFSLLATSIFTSTTTATTINLSFDPADFSGATGAMALSGFQTASTFWENAFTDNITVNLGIGFAALSPTTLGSTHSNQAIFSYDDIRNALAGDITSAEDTLAVASLICEDQGNSACNRSFLDTEADGTGGATPGLDNDGSADNQFLALTQANAKALGFTTSSFNTAFTASDADISFNSAFNFDYDNSNGVDANKIDFVSVAIHEIGHALGFISGVDSYDFFYNQTPPSNLDNNAVASTLDLFRYSDESVATGTSVLDYRPGANSYFSIDSGTTNLALFSTGVFAGDGRQASHWKDNLGIGALDPTVGFGEIAAVTSLDLLAFDAIGWDLAATNPNPNPNPNPTVPVPASFLLLMFGLVGLGYSAKKTLKK